MCQHQSRCSQHTATNFVLKHDYFLQCQIPAIFFLTKLGLGCVPRLISKYIWPDFGAIVWIKTFSRLFCYRDFRLIEICLPILFVVAGLSSIAEVVPKVIKKVCHVLTSCQNICKRLCGYVFYIKKLGIFHQYNVLPLWDTFNFCSSSMLLKKTVC